ncbi:MAG TPA: YgaP-like transmembrane domain [Terriglobales bacterium]|jgi:hypothetical protein|nr:YgaP-like transmembrane domain [Terriglobales bacterium]HKC71582.1 YgaP-like transmembrane domain [Terriglobales bacterium]HYL95864.1 YgaP-like transmembrane domain [Terriglobales bacterium]
MPLIRNLGRTHRIIYLVIGVALIAYAAVTMGLIARLGTVLLLIVGILFVWSAWYGH